MNILVTGASGFIGSHIVRALAARGHHITACVRNLDAAHLPQGVSAMPCDFSADLTPEVWRNRLQGIEVVINAVGIIRERGRQSFEALHKLAPQALFRACEQTGVRRVIQISALGADAAAQSRYHLTKRAADESLARSRLEWVILRPSLIHGPGGASGVLFRALAALPLTPVVGDGQQMIRPVHVDDLVRAVVASVEGNAIGKRIDVVGAEETTFVAYLGAWRRWLGLGKLRAFCVPYRAALWGAKLAGFLGRQPVNADTVQMLQRGNSAALEPLIETFGFRPSGVTDWLQAQPAGAPERWQATLYFLRPLLRLSIGFVWVWAALTSAWLYPQASSYALLTQVGITGTAAPLALYSASLLDLWLGLATWFRWRLRAAARIQLAVMLAYTAILTLWLPDWWLHPFGPVAKNLPLLVATLIMLALEEPKS